MPDLKVVSSDGDFQIDNETTETEIDEACGVIDNLMQNLTDLQGEWQALFDDLSERAQNGKTGERYQDHIDALQSAIDELDGISDKVREGFDAMGEHRK